MKCQIRWVNNKGKPTPDTNEAVCIAVVSFKYPDGEINIHRYPCCKKHAIELDSLVARGPMPSIHEERILYTSQWTREELGPTVPICQESGCERCMAMEPSTIDGEAERLDTLRDREEQMRVDEHLGK